MEERGRQMNPVDPGMRVNRVWTSEEHASEGAKTYLLMMMTGTLQCLKKYWARLVLLITWNRHR